MDYGRPDVADQLAAAYVAGTLRGAARRRFETLLAAHPALRGATREWEALLMPLTTTVDAEPPPARVWQRIEARLDGKGRPDTARPSARAGALGSALALWRGLAAVFAVAALALGVLLATPGPVQPPIVVVLAPTGSGPAGVTTASFVASISGDGRALVTRPIVDVALQADRALELWAIPPGGAPRSLGLISPRSATVVRRDKGLAGADTLAVSLEPPGGSPSGAPTGPVLYAGKFSL